jgi:hypothetical protein
MSPTSKQDTSSSPGNIVLTIFLLALIALPIYLGTRPDDDGDDNNDDSGDGGGGTPTQTPVPSTSSFPSPGPTRRPVPDELEVRRSNIILVYAAGAIAAFGFSALAWIGGITKFGLNYSLALDVVIAGPGFATICVVCGSILLNLTALFWIAFAAHIAVGLIALMLSGIYGIIAYMVLSIVPIIMIYWYDATARFEIVPGSFLDPGYVYYLIPVFLLILDFIFLLFIFGNITEKVLSKRGVEGKESVFDERLWLYKETIYSRYIDMQNRIGFFSKKFGTDFSNFDEEFVQQEKLAKANERIK